MKFNHYLLISFVLGACTSSSMSFAQTGDGGGHVGGESGIVTHYTNTSTPLPIHPVHLTELTPMKSIHAQE